MYSTVVGNTRQKTSSIRLRSSLFQRMIINYIFLITSPTLLSTDRADFSLQLFRDVAKHFRAQARKDFIFVFSSFASNFLKKAGTNQLINRTFESPLNISLIHTHAYFPKDGNVKSNICVRRA